ncbi:hypothetical protein A0H81_00667 [Grifola frondosa]|uniref:GYF domain-containing protein n=1 Tax=Grifola frondosa TaxID=5627 RepID=A0A1C7MQK5_GRIFR|nr:hypothetical protein A0H81_00667 [Grifola frondosa]
MASYPAGLSADSLDLNHASSSSLPPMQDDQWSDAHYTVETDDERDIIEEVQQHQEDLTVRGNKISTPDKTHDIDTPSPTALSPTNPQEHASDVDATSVHSMPIVHVTEPTSPTAPMTPRSASSRHSPSSSTNLAPPSALSQDRRRQTRSTASTASIDQNRTSNRISGFFSNLIHRRDSPSSAAPESNTPSSPQVVTSSRASSPAPTRPSTPPPRLPPPSLRDLGLTLSSLTTHLSPSHFSNPPTSGAFLAPHYLLLCHSQGLDVLPLISPPAPQPYALVRRAPFKSVVIMEHRGVLVAIAGRRDGVRVYALDEVKRMVEWRMDVESRRERERARREETKRNGTAIAFLNHDDSEKRGSTEKQLSGKTPTTPVAKNTLTRRSTVSSVPPVPSVGPPRTPVARVPKPKAPAQAPPVPVGPPPAYSGSPPREREPSVPPVSQTRSRAASVGEVLAGTLTRRPTSIDAQGAHDDDAKGDWASSDDEAINVVAAPSGSRALDERTSSMAAAPSSTSGPSGRLEIARSQTAPSIQTHSTRRNRPANLDLSLTRSNTVTNVIPVPPPSPTPTLLTLRQALIAEPDADADADADEEEDGDPVPSSPTTPTRERITLAEALFESRIPDLPPAGTRRSQEVILLESRSPVDEAPASPRTSESNSTFTRRSTGDQSVARRRRRWSVLGGVFTASSGQSQSSIPSLPEDAQLTHVASPTDAHMPEMRECVPGHLVETAVNISRFQCRAGTRSQYGTGATPSGASCLKFLAFTLPSSHHYQCVSWSPFGRLTSASAGGDADPKKVAIASPPPHAPAPKMDYVKLPGTKGALMVKAVETAKKSFLAILCGDNGEKVELFAGTYRTALGLSRTFILPDSPRSLELQLQGDDLVEVFLVFSQNVFGLEPATVRVREVRIGRAERRAARRRARELMGQQTPEAGDTDGAAAGDEDTSVNVTIGVAVTPPHSAGLQDDTGTPQQSSSSVVSQPSEAASQAQIDSSGVTANSTDELITLAAAQVSPYSTFQQLTFSPKFPLATISDEYIIPPTYASFLDYRNEHEPDVVGVDLTQVQFSPPGLPFPLRLHPRNGSIVTQRRLYMASLMQAWYRDGLLPPDLPVRREEDTDYILLKDLRLQCVDPSHPFRSSPPPPAHAPSPLVPDASKPLLPPISLLSQPKHFGPPALFYSSRGGHSTTIVDARGRSVLKGRFLWSSDDLDDDLPSRSSRLGDVKRLEAFDVKDRAVLVAMRQGGLEVVDFGDALLRPADYSRTLYPHFHPLPRASTGGDHFIMLSKPGASRKKQSTGPAKSPGRTDFSLSGDVDSERIQDEVLFLGRKDDDMYLCERTPHSFRILKLSPNAS